MRVLQSRETVVSMRTPGRWPWLCFGCTLIFSLAPANPQRPTRSSGAASPNPVCAVTEMHLVGHGAGPDWSLSGNDLIAFFRKDDSGVTQIWTLRPDGSQIQCLTCQNAPGLPAKVHKGSPSWHPSGRYILFQAEMAKHLGPSRPAEPGIGWWNDVWLMTADGRRFWQLTHYNPHGATAVLMPRFSRDGTRVAWTELIAGPRDRKMATGPFGRWQIHIADFAMDSGVPSLRNIQSMAPGNGIFYEFQDWSPSGANILFAADIGLPSPYVLDLFDLNLKTGELRNLTNSNDQWDEQGTYSPNGRKIVYMSSRNNPEFNPKSLKSLRAEDFLMDSDGRNNVQLTHFNTPGAPEYAGEQSAATKATWSPDGTRLLLEQLMLGRSYSTRDRSRLHLLTFAGACGTR